MRLKRLALVEDRLREIEQNHKHVTNQANIQPSIETCLEEVMAVILDKF